MITAESLEIGYGRKNVASGIGFSVSDGECILLAGANGCGKSTILRTLAGVVTPLSGRFRADGPVRMIPSRIPKVKGFTLTQFIHTGCYRDSDWALRISPVAKENVREAIEMLGLGAIAYQDISTLSDGQFQKACIATAVSSGARTLLLDEPTAYLDPDNKVAVLDSLKRCAREKSLCVLYSSHDIHFGARSADRVMSFGGDGVFRVSSEDPESKAETLGMNYLLLSR